MLESTTTTTNDIARLQELYEYDILDSAEEKEFNDLAELASLVCDCPMATISFIDRERQWFKARKNMADSETTLPLSFCTKTILRNEVLVVENALEHPLFKDYPNVTGGMKIRFYAGAPIYTTRGIKIGTICAFDTRSKRLTDQQISAMERLATQVSKLLELRLTNKQLKQNSFSLLKSVRSYQEFFDDAPFAQLIADAETYQLMAVNKAACVLYNYDQNDFLDRSLRDIMLVPIVDSEIERASQTRANATFVANHIKQDKTEIVVEVNVSTIIYNSARVLIITIVDLSEKLQLQKNLYQEQLSAQEKIEQAAISAQTREREYLGQELHDNINQLLAGAKLYLDIAYKNDKLRLDMIQESRGHLLTVISEVQTLSRKLVDSSTKGIHVIEAISELLEPYQMSGAFRVIFVHTGDVNSIPMDLKIGLLRIIQETIHNISKHASADTVKLILSITDHISLTIQDNGKGFDPSRQAEGIGIRNIKERIRQAHGRVTIESSPGKGCKIEVNIPATPMLQ